MTPHAHRARPRPHNRLRRARVALIAGLAASLALTGFAVAPAFAAPSSTAASTTLAAPAAGIFADDMRPAVAADRDRGAVELGIRFSPETSGKVTALQYYQGTKTGPVTHATLWSSDGKVLAKASFVATTQVGWRTVALATPVALTAGRTYVASYNAPDGRYPVGVSDLNREKRQNGFTLPAGAGVYRYGTTKSVPTSTYRGSNYLVDVVYEASDTPIVTPKPPTTPEPTPTATATPKPTPTVTAAPEPPTTPATGGIKVLDRWFPNSDTTGVPAGTSLSAYTGPCTISASNVVIDSKTINCDLRVTGQNLTIKNSVLNGAIYTNSGSFTVTDSDIRLSAAEDTGVGEANFTLTRVEITGGRRSVNCAEDCTIQDSYIHAQGVDPSGQAHQSGIRMGANSTLRHNTFTCDAPASPPSGGCSAALTGYGDFAVVEKNTIDNNLILASTGGYCSYGGSTTGKPYSAGVNNIKFTNNIWQRGKTGVCGIWGPIVSFDRGAPGNVWSNNMFDDGKAITP